MILPSCMTAIRSLSPRISSISLEIIIIATPLSARSRIKLIDLGLCADIDAACRFVKDQKLRIERKPFCQHDFLLVAAAQICRLCFDRRRLYVRAFRTSRAAFLLSRSLLTSPARRISRQGGQRDVFADRQIDDQSRDAAIFRHQINTVSDRIACRMDIDAAGRRARSLLTQPDRHRRSPVPPRNVRHRQARQHRGSRPLRTSNEIDDARITSRPKISDLGKRLPLRRSPTAYRNARCRVRPSA